MTRASVMYNYVRGRQLERTYPGGPETGFWVTTSMRVLKGWGSPPESTWPYDGDPAHWPPIEPPNIDATAKHHRALAYQRVTDILDCERVLAARIPAVVALEIDDEWFSANRGVIGDTSAAKFAHSVSMVGYDRSSQRFTIRNSWGESWGDEGYGSIPYACLNRYMIDGWFVVQMEPRGEPAPESRIALRGWGIPTPVGSQVHGIEIVDGQENEMIGWAMVVERPGVLDIEELFVRPAYRERGHAATIAAEIAVLAKNRQRALRAWIAHPDLAPSNEAALAHIIKRLGLKRQATDKRWAAGVAIPTA